MSTNLFKHLVSSIGLIIFIILATGSILPDNNKEDTRQYTPKTELERLEEEYARAKKSYNYTADDYYEAQAGRIGYGSVRLEAIRTSESLLKLKRERLDEAEKKLNQYKRKMNR